jgi:Uncharacterized protein conserved in bacteria (DUF2334)
VSRDRIDRDSERSRRLLFAPELADGTLRPSRLARTEVREATRARRVPSSVSRRLQRALLDRGALRVREQTIEPALAARRAVLGDAAAGPPRLLVRAGDVPHPLADEDPARYGTQRFRRFHEAMAQAGMRYLVAVTPRVSHDPHDPRGRGDRPLADDELELLADLRRDGVAFAAHGLDHRTRHRAADRRGELVGLSKRELAQRLDRAAAQLAEVAIRPEVFVPPFGRIGWKQWGVLAARYPVVAAGGASLTTMGYHDTPLWRGEAVWMPTYAPFDGPAAEAADAVSELVEAQAALWVPVAVDWSEDVDGEGLARLTRVAARFSVDWELFLAAVRASTETL